jgi:hypothetical protein
VAAGVYSDSFTVNCPATNIDPGPSQGRLPTDAFLVNGPVVNRALLSAMFPPGTRRKNSGNVNFDSPDRRTPYTRQASVGYERQLSGTMAVRADYIRNDLRDLRVHAVAHLRQHRGARQYRDDHDAGARSAEPRAG